MLLETIQERQDGTMSVRLEQDEKKREAIIKGLLELIKTDNEKDKAIHIATLKAYGVEV